MALYNWKQKFTINFAFDYLKQNENERKKDEKKITLKLHGN